MCHSTYVQVRVQFSHSMWAPGFELRLSGKHLYPVSSLTAPKTHLIWSRNLHEEDRGDEPSGNQNTSL